MNQKDATCGNTERAQGTEKLTANVNDEKYKRKSRKGQKGENKHEKSKDFECDAEPKATERLKPAPETAEKEPGRTKEGRPKPAESKKQFTGTRSLLSPRKSIGEWESKQRVRGRKAITQRKSQILLAV
jgi:hypothetical protein